MTPPIEFLSYMFDIFYYNTERISEKEDFNKEIRWKLINRQFNF